MINIHVIKQAKLHFPFFSHLFNNSEKISQLTYQQIGEGNYPFLEGHYYPFVSLVLKGTLRVSKIGENGREITLYRVQEGESCILLISSALSQEPYPATAFVEEDSEVIHVPIGLFQEELSSNLHIQSFTYQLYNKRIANMMSLIEEVVFNKMDKRVAEFLLNNANSDMFTIEITHEILAMELGSAREVISRLLKEFEKNELISLSRGKILIHSREKLSHFLQSL